MRLRVHVNGQTYLDGTEIDSEDLFYRMRHDNGIPSLSVPTIEEFVEVYEKLNKSTSQIIAVTFSAE